MGVGADSQQLGQVGMVKSGQEGNLLSDLSVGIQQVLGLFGEIQELSYGGLLKQAINFTQENLHCNTLPGMLHKRAMVAVTTALCITMK